MFRPALRACAAPLSILRASARTCRGQRFISTAPPHQKSRSWKSLAARWGLVGAAIYYYNTSPVFADEPRYTVHAPPEVPDEAETYETIEDVAKQRKAQARENNSTPDPVGSEGAPAPGSPEALEEEASQQGAFNEETGEINWDCPCLGGMAYGPCGEQFREAFSCFVFSKEEPKGVDCIDRFKAMQDCFREHPDIYGGELELDEEDAQSPPPGEHDTPADSSDPPTARPVDNAETPGGEKAKSPSPEATSSGRERAEAVKEQVAATTSREPEGSEALKLVPKSAHDAR